LKALRCVCHNQAIQSETKFTLDGSLKQLERLTDEVARFCSERSLWDDMKFDLDLALEELFVNSVRHGGCDGIEEAVEIRLRVDGTSVLVEFSDRGVPFDPTSAPPPNLDAPAEERRPGGLGIHLVRQMMRDFKYRREGDRNQISMRREG
jgi:anti-sigma regulatory factor (Ser/Thr protein kinase)